MDYNNTDLHNTAPQTEDTLGHMNILYQEHTSLALSPVTDAKGTTRLIVTLDNGNELRVQLVTEGLKRNDWYYDITHVNKDGVTISHHLCVSPRHLETILHGILLRQLREGIRVRDSETCTIIKS